MVKKIRMTVVYMFLCNVIVLSQVAPPTFNPEAGFYANGQSITLSTSTPNAIIRYTTDGSSPTGKNSTLYSTPINISNNTNIKAVAVKNGMQSIYVFANYFINKSVKQAIEIVNKMSLDEKIDQLHGWGNRSIEASVHVPLYYLTNGPAGVGHAGIGHGGTATALPAPISLAATFDSAISRQYGVIVGSEALAYSNTMIEAPCLNIARLPQCGRTFEAYGEDPYLAGYIGVANVIGIQSQGISAESKHFACNNQETDRRFSNSIVDERTLREIYLPAFEATVKEGKVDAVMSAYNLVNGSYCSENMTLLRQILKGEWGFDGYVTSDFSALKSTIPSALAGCDVEMQHGKFYTTQLLKAVKSGSVPVKLIDEMLIRRFSKTMSRGLFHEPSSNQSIPSKENGSKARLIAAAGMVLLKNDKKLLPLKPSTVNSIALIGRDISHAKIGGGGSSAVKPIYSVTPQEGIRKKLKAGATIELNTGANIDEVIALAKKVDVVIVVVDDSLREGHDFSISLSGNQDTLAGAVAKVNPNTVVVLKTGTVALMPWINDVSAVLEAWYPGEEDGNALADILFGDINPSGKLPITFPAKEADLPAQVSKDSVTKYTEDVFVGYRYFDANNKTPLFPFGHGLSYTTFQYENLSVKPERASFENNPQQKIHVELDLLNSGNVMGSETVQIYVGIPAIVPQPPRQLKGIKKVALRPGNSEHLTVDLDYRSFSYWNINKHEWTVSPGNYEIFIGSSSRDIRLKGQITILDTN